MTPPCRVFEAAALESEVRKDVAGKRRKGGDVDLSKCELMSMLQYDCQIDHPERRNSPTRCWPVQRWFRRCQDSKGSFMVETTTWEGRQPVDAPEDVKGKPDANAGGEWVNSWRERH